MEKLKLVPMPPGIHAGKLHEEARSYIEASRMLADDPQSLIGPRYFLLCHGLELALKAVLAANGDRFEILVNLGHDLNAAYDKARVEYGLELPDPLIERLIRLMSPGHKKQLFRYPGTIWLELPRSDQCCDAIDRFLDQIGDVVESARVRALVNLASMKLAPDPDRVE